MKNAGFKEVIVFFVLLIGLTGVFYFYQTSHIVKDEYQRICMANYPKDPEYTRCFEPYYSQKSSLLTSVEVETGLFVLSLIVLPFLKKK